MVGNDPFTMDPPLAWKKACEQFILPNVRNNVNQVWYVHTIYLEILATFLIWQLGSQDQNHQNLYYRPSYYSLSLLCNCQK